MKAAREGAKVRGVKFENEWETIPLRYVCQLNPSVDFNGFGEEDELTFLPMDRVKNGYFIPNSDSFGKYASSYNAFEEGDIILAKVTPCFENGNIAIAEGLANGKGFGSSELFVVRPTKVERKFLFYYFQSSTFKQQGEASMTGAGGLKRVSPDLLRQHHLPSPSLATQRLIADYLDRETAYIDALVAEKETMLALLEEKRAALISRAVTRGLNPDAPLKPSGLDWLGDIPAHWELRRGKCLFIQSALPVQEEDEIVTCFRNGTVTLRKNRREDGYTNAVLELGYQGIEAGQLVLHSMDAFAGAIGISDSNGKCSPEYIICNPISEEIVNNYYGILLRVMALRGYILAACTAVRERAPRIRFSHLATMFLPLPPKNEQEKIVLFLRNARSNTEEIEQMLVKSIGFLKERRAALITAAVTGQIDLEQTQKMSRGRHEN